MTYTYEMLKADKDAIEQAQSGLNKFLLGHGPEVAIYTENYLRVAQLFEHPVKELISAMFVDLLTNTRISGMRIVKYAEYLKQCIKQMRSKVVFGRRKNLTCFKLKEHKQPCFCAKVAALKASQETPLVDVEEQQARITGILVLNRELETDRA